MVTLTQDKIAEFQQNGATVIRGAFTKDWLDVIERGIEANLAEPSPTGAFADAEKTFFQDTNNWQRIPEFRDFAMNSPARLIAAQLLRATKINFLHDHTLVKKPGSGKRTLWHQDQPYSPIDGRDFLTMWTPVDHVARETTLEFIKGSHDWGKWFRPQQFATGSLRDGDDEKWHVLPDIEANRDEYEILGWEMEPGDIAVFFGTTLHGASGNRLNVPRRVLTTRWIGDNAVFRRRAGKMSPPVPAENAPEDGGPIDCPTFPVVWRADAAA